MESNRESHPSGDLQSTIDWLPVGCFRVELTTAGAVSVRESAGVHQNGCLPPWSIQILNMNTALRRFLHCPIENGDEALLPSLAELLQPLAAEQTSSRHRDGCMQVDCTVRAVMPGKTSLFRIQAGSEAFRAVRGAEQVCVWQGVINDVTNEQDAKEDVTKQLEEAQEELKFFQKLLDNIPCWVAVTRWNPCLPSEKLCEIKYSNRYSETLIEYSIDDVKNVGNVLGTLVVEEDTDITVNTVLEGMRSRQPCRAVFRLKRKNGSPLWTMTRSVPMQDPSDSDEGKLFVSCTVNYEIEKALQQELERSRSELLKQRDEYQQLLACLPVGVMKYLTDAVDTKGDGVGTVLNKKVLYANERFHEIQGRKLNSELEFADYIHPEDSQAAFEVVSRALKTLQPCECNIRLLQEDGTYRWLRFVVAPGAVEGDSRVWFSIISNIDELKRQEEELRKKELLERERVDMEKLLNKFPAALFKLKEWVGKDPENMALDVLYLNKKAEHVKKNVSVSRVYEDIALNHGRFTMRSKMQDKDWPEAFAAIERARKTLEPTTYDMRIHYDEEGIEWRRHTVVCDPVSEDGTQTWYGVAIDISREKEAEEMLKEQQAMMQAATSYRDTGLFYLHLDSGVIRRSGEVWRSLNRGGVDSVESSLCTLASNEDCCGISLDEYLLWVHEEDRKELEEALHSRTSLEVITRFYDGDGTMRWLMHRASPFEGRNGLGMSGAVKDITQRKLAEIDLLTARTVAEKASKEKSSFLASMAHEIRTPLNAIIGLGELMEDTQLSAEQRNYMETICASGQTLLGIVNATLDVSKIEAGKFVLERIRFNLLSCVEKALQQVACRAFEKGLDLAYVVKDCCSSVPEIIVADEQRLLQILLNLLSNAVKFSATGSIVVELISLGATTTKENHGHERRNVDLQFNVRDFGVGIAQEVLSKLFQPYTQADESTTRHYGGTGLGLHICQQLCQMMGGKIWVESALGAGSTFCFTIRAECDPLEDRQPAGPEKWESLKPPAGEVYVILAGPEDAPSLQSAACMLKAHIHFKVEHVESLEAALLRYSEHGPPRNPQKCVILVDEAFMPHAPPPSVAAAALKLLSQGVHLAAFVIPQRGNRRVADGFRQAKSCLATWLPGNERLFTPISKPVGRALGNILQQLVLEDGGAESVVGVDYRQNPPDSPSVDTRRRRAGLKEPANMNGLSLFISRKRKQCEADREPLSFELQPSPSSPAPKFVREQGSFLATEDGGKCNGLSILVAEDNTVNQMVVVRLLERLGFQADVVGNGQECILAAVTKRYDVILMDVHMPVLNGLQATRVVKSLPSPPLVVALTAAALSTEKEACLAEGMMDYFLTKPLRSPQLSEILEICKNRLSPGASVAEATQICHLS